MKYFFTGLILLNSIQVMANESIQRMTNALQSPEVMQTVGSKGAVLVASYAAGIVSLTVTNGISNYPESAGGVQEFCITFERNGRVWKQDDACYGD